ncbi:hypothetical protein [Paractinoplanes hotanensis]|uniref:Uncharacterized protein n=1 Tax=Paractinoplanes hotanensis TaxID=2906497 RepID=A0ABT0YCX7_9ACTN|nr:hypothetical protein [Actinoplanes hotanensis]MCM4083894.1 hypothetical protein [Actinoplanes hotanensis]
MILRTSRQIWVGRGIFAIIVTSLTVYLSILGIDKSDKVASCVAAVAAILALGAPYLLPLPDSGSNDLREDLKGAPAGPNADRQGSDKPPVSGGTSVHANKIENIQTGQGSFMLVGSQPRHVRGKRGTPPPRRGK